RIKRIALVIIQLNELLFDGIGFLAGLGLFALAGRWVDSYLLQIIQTRGELLAEVAQVIEYHTDGIRTVTMQIDKCAEGTLRTAEQPVDWTLLVALHMVGIELAQEVVAQAIVAL